MLKADCEAWYWSRGQEFVAFGVLVGHSNRPRVLVAQTLKTRAFLICIWLLAMDMYLKWEWKLIFDSYLWYVSLQS